ncbi:MAG: DUF3810 domain-containing protein [Lachnospiraceae bacterium]
MSERMEKERKEQKEQTRAVCKQVFLRKRTLLLFLIPLGILLLELAKGSAVFTEEVFAKRIYKVFSVCVSFLTGFLPFSLAEAIVLFAPLLLLLLLIFFVRRVLKARGGNGTVFHVFMSGILNMACAVSVFFFIYVIGCGINYYRYPVSYYLGLQVEKSSEEELRGLLTELAQTASGLRAELSEDEDGVYVLPMSTKELGRLAAEAYETFAEEYDIFSGHYPEPKRVFLSRAMSYTQITGIYTCWTMEANVNVDISPYSIASTMCHELSHLRGFMREDEANYISYRVCMASDSPDVQYSGVMHALIHTGNALYGKNPEAYYEIVSQYYSAGVRRDLVANSEYWEQFEHTKVAETSEKINDTYLKANNQTDGTQSYGRVVDLLLAEYRQRK